MIGGLKLNSHSAFVTSGSLGLGLVILVLVLRNWPCLYITDTHTHTSCQTDRNVGAAAAWALITEGRGAVPPNLEWRGQ